MQKNIRTPNTTRGDCGIIIGMNLEITDKAQLSEDKAKNKKRLEDNIAKKKDLLKE